MRYVVPAALLVTALIHALPAVGVISAGKLTTLYGIPVQEPNLEVLLRHRAVLFGLLAAFLAYAAFHPPLFGLALVAGLASTLSFVALALRVGGYNPALSTVLRVDIVAALVLGGAAAVHWLPRLRV